jgi:hypothetical protein
MKVPRGFESHPLRQPVLDAEKFRVASAKSARARHLLNSESTREVPIRETPAPFARILSVSIFGGGLWRSEHRLVRSYSPRFAEIRRRAEGLALTEDQLCAEAAHLQAPVLDLEKLGDREVDLLYERMARLKRPAM